MKTGFFVLIRADSRGILMTLFRSFFLLKVIVEYLSKAIVSVSFKIFLKTRHNHFS